jgi:hypothetical protein
MQTLLNEQLQSFDMLYVLVWRESDIIFLALTIIILDALKKYVMKNLECSLVGNTFIKTVSQFDNY